jgi:hypothetical protein
VRERSIFPGVKSTVPGTFTICQVSGLYVVGYVYDVSDCGVTPGQTSLERDRGERVPQQVV